METRREFLKKAALLSGGAAVWTLLPESVARALAIDPETGSTYLDAEHIVILMQENRSFDHSYGTLQGVRGFNDPRAHVLPNLNPVWFQTNADGDTFGPFRLNIKETNITWIGGLPHSWGNQVDARNGGRFDKWLIAKPFGNKNLKKMPMTMGHYTREDIPFYYALADAFTICDQHFCSSLTGTSPNRNYFWTGTIRPKQNASSKAHVYNEETDEDHEVGWATFPERLEDAGISWKIYQNELSVESGFEGEEDAWLSNFGCNPAEYFTQFNVRFSPRHYRHLQNRVKAIPGEIEALSKAPADETSKQTDARAKKLRDLQSELKDAQAGLVRWSPENFEKLSQRKKNLHAKAFTINENDPHFRSLETLSYHDGETERTVQVPKGDVFHQFRADVQSGTLPAVSWIVGPEHFSDHPASAWYGAWFVSEALDILTQNPEVWKKTIFILTYDENDGYFDHVPPFVAPNPNKPETGLVSEGIDASVEYITREQDLVFRPTYKPRDNSIGLGFRVPMVVASPWSRGGCVCSQVFDHTSVLQFLEHFLSHKTGKHVEEPNISSWRRTVCGNLTSIFQPFNGERPEAITFEKRDEVIEGIHRAKFKQLPSPMKPLTTQEIEAAKRNPAGASILPSQEPGTRKSCPLPYELYADGGLNADKTEFELHLRAGPVNLGQPPAGSPFNVYCYDGQGDLQTRAYAVAVGMSVSDSWAASRDYHVRVDGPNGFMREFKGTTSSEILDVRLGYAKDRSRRTTGAVEIYVKNLGDQPQECEVSDLSYGGPTHRETIPAKAQARIVVNTDRSSGWYDLGLKMVGADSFDRRFAGRVETGKWSITDPAMGRI